MWCGLPTVVACIGDQSSRREALPGDVRWCTSSASFGYKKSPLAHRYHVFQTGQTHTIRNHIRDISGLKSSWNRRRAYPCCEDLRLNRTSYALLLSSALQTPVPYLHTKSSSSSSNTKQKTNHDISYSNLIQHLTPEAELPFFFYLKKKNNN